MDIHYVIDGVEKTLTVDVDDNSYRYRAIKGEHSLTLYFSLKEHIEIPVGAYCVYEELTYTLEEPENFKMNNSRNFDYTLIMESYAAKAKKYKFRNPVDRRLKFNLTAKPREHLQMFVDNLNLRESGWTVGECIDASEKLISYNHAYCIDALTQQAEAFETEYEFIGKVVSLRKVEYNKDNPLPLSYGRGNGFKPGVGRTNFNDSKPVEILFVQGGEQNIDASKYKSKELLLPKGQTLSYDGTHFENESGFNASSARTYISDADGFSTQRADKPLKSKTEDSLDLSNIYPNWEHAITKVEFTEEGFCNIFAENTAEYRNNSPSDLNYNDCRIGGETATVIFQSGMLAGKEFDIMQTDKALTGYDYNTKKFMLVSQEIDGLTMPDKDNDFKPIIGDKFRVFGITLPDNYVCHNATKTGASWDMFREAAKYLYENEEQKFTFTGELDGIWAKKDWANIGGRIKLGGYVLFSDPQFQPDGIAIRIIGIKDYINNPHSPEIELSNSTVGGSITSDLRKSDNNEVLTDHQYKDSLQFTKRRWRDAQETMTMISEAMIGNFANSVNPVTVQTMAMLVGDESLQFQFVRSLTDHTQVTHNVAYDKATKTLHFPEGTIKHYTLGIDAISSSHKPEDYKVWELRAVDKLPAHDKKYFVYAKVSATSQIGEFYISETAIKMDSCPEYYYLLMGVLNSEYNGERSYVTLYGYTEILPGRITTDRIVSSDLNTYFDLLNGEIGGKIKFVSSGGNYQYVNEAIDAKTCTFTIAQPDPPYSKGDTWLKYNGEIMTCIISRTTGKFAVGDWNTAGNYATPEQTEYLRTAFEKYTGAATEINGGLVLSSFVGVRDEHDKITAFMNGVPNAKFGGWLNGSAFAAGVQNLGEDTSKAIIDLKHEGVDSKMGVFRVYKDGVGIDTSYGTRSIIFSNKSVDEVVGALKYESHYDYMNTYERNLINDDVAGNFTVNGTIVWGIAPESPANVKETIILAKATVKNSGNYIINPAYYKMFNFGIGFTIGGNNSGDYRPYNIKVQTKVDYYLLVNGVKTPIKTASQSRELADWYSWSLEHIGQTYNDAASWQVSYSKDKITLDGAVEYNIELIAEVSYSFCYTIVVYYGPPISSASEVLTYTKFSMYARTSIVDPYSKFLTFIQTGLLTSYCNDGIKFMSIDAAGTTNTLMTFRHGIKQNEYGNPRRISIEASLPSYSEASTGEWYKDTDGTIKVK